MLPVEIPAPIIQAVQEIQDHYFRLSLKGMMMQYDSHTGELVLKIKPF